ncbi:MAG: hypothetical protein COA74_13645 [Gammaproteobacteria bacterium]|nr:MAG: hypothetical protein COA74_13645 [Gammaproteobacteria bacterium]
MKKFSLGIALILLLLSVSSKAYANSPTEALELTVNKLIAIARNKAIDSKQQKIELQSVINLDVDFEAVSRRVVVKPWKKSSADQKLQFKKLFSNIVVNTYFSLLENYSDEEVVYVKEQLKGKKYAIVDTQILSDNKKVPVRYRMIKAGDTWKIYDFVPEGISLVSSYKKNYASILKKQGMDGLLKEMIKKEQQRTKEHLAKE